MSAAIDEGCAAAPLPAAASAWVTRFGIATVVDEAGGATLTAGSVGVPLPGQRPVSETDVIRARARLSGAESTEETASALAAAAAKAADEAERNKTLWQRVQPYAMPIGIFFLLQTFLGGDKPAAAKRK